MKWSRNGATNEAVFGSFLKKVFWAIDAGMFPKDKSNSACRIQTFIFVKSHVEFFNICANTIEAHFIRATVLP